MLIVNSAPSHTYFNFNTASLERKKWQSPNLSLFLGTMKMTCRYVAIFLNTVFGITGDFASVLCLVFQVAIFFTVSFSGIE